MVMASCIGLVYSGWQCTLVAKGCFPEEESVFIATHSNKLLLKPGYKGTPLLGLKLFYTLLPAHFVLENHLAENNARGFRKNDML